MGADTVDPAGKRVVHPVALPACLVYRYIAFGRACFALQGVSASVTHKNFDALGNWVSPPPE